MNHKKPLLTICCFCMFFHIQASSDCTCLDGVSSSDATLLQQIADKITFDSLLQRPHYRHYSYPGFNYTLAGNKVSVNNSNPIIASSEWNFGDGSNDASSDPVHIYTTSGKYVGSQPAFNNCFSETLSDTINVGLTGLTNVEYSHKYPIQIEQNSSQNITIIPATHNANDEIEVFGIDSRLLGCFSFSDIIKLQLAPAMYRYIAYAKQNGIVTAAISCLLILL